MRAFRLIGLRGLRSLGRVSGALRMWNKGDGASQLCDLGLIQASKSLATFGARVPSTLVSTPAECEAGVRGAQKLLIADAGPGHISARAGHMKNRRLWEDGRASWATRPAPGAAWTQGAL